MEVEGSKITFKKSEKTSWSRQLWVVIEEQVGIFQAPEEVESFRKRETTCERGKIGGIVACQPLCVVAAEMR